MFKKIKQTNRSVARNLPTVRLVKREVFFNSVALKMYFEGKEAVEILWDEEGQKIGLIPLEKKTEDGYKIHRYGGISPYGVVSVPELLKAVGPILSEKKLKTLPVSMGENNTLIVNLGG